MDGAHLASTGQVPQKLPCDQRTQNSYPHKLTAVKLKESVESHCSPYQGEMGGMGGRGAPALFCAGSGAGSMKSKTKFSQLLQRAVCQPWYKCVFVGWYNSILEVVGANRKLSDLSQTVSFSNLNKYWMLYRE